MEKLVRRLSLPEAVGLSVSIICPTVTAAFNITLVVQAAGPAAPLTFVIGTLAMALVALSFVAFSRRVAHAGSAYAYISHTFGSRLLGRFRVALEKANEAEKVFRERCTGVAWEIDTIQSCSLCAMYYLGQLAEEPFSLNLIVDHFGGLVIRVWPNPTKPPSRHQTADHSPGALMNK